MSRKAAERSRNERRERAAKVLHDQERNQRLRRAAVWLVALAAVGGIVSAMMLTSRPQSSDDVKSAPDFTLTDTAGATHSLSDHRGDNVLLYFSEGAGCQSCLVQMAEVERHMDELRDLDVTVLPIVMNTREQILQDMAANGVRTPFLLDDGTVSGEYGTLGKGMHAGLPGHSFVLIDSEGRQRWYGEYPSMWLAPEKLIDEVRARLA
ncbi:MULTISPECIES: peroxiredoxin family protein [unclassified Nocardioides]|uniref:peroxiredoxin family protein n=1 Tax=unclassified Nocardioides TaxID=2615069 RepID=UPI000057194D|nr:MULTISPECIES: peroxiredoxin family protein [unclassified Nocardioides]ABL83285.1 Redoxin domain protein [Nocardioides sp. JS614]